MLGEPIERPERFAGRVGALIENPAIVGSLSGRDNLRSLAALRGLPASRIDAVIETVGLTGRDGDRTGNGTHSSSRESGGSGGCDVGGERCGSC